MIFHDLLFLFVYIQTFIYLNVLSISYSGDIMKNLELTTKEAVDYLKENLKIHDVLEISYNRIYASGEILNVDFSEYFGEPGFKLLISMDDSDLGATVELDVYELEDDIIEFIHKPKEGEEVEVTVI